MVMPARKTRRPRSSISATARKPMKLMKLKSTIRMLKLTPKMKVSLPRTRMTRWCHSTRSTALCWPKKAWSQFPACNRGAGAGDVAADVGAEDAPGADAPAADVLGADARCRRRCLRGVQAGSDSSPAHAIRTTSWRNRAIGLTSAITASGSGGVVIVAGRKVDMLKLCAESSMIRQLATGRIAQPRAGTGRTKRRVRWQPVLLRRSWLGAGASR
mmetsp:Transcript_46254/g.109936  ORF Transcript_46254/g.109936 Transcript_46254/m.109936 type:complete len:215 (+) Transcript_46254:3635-4279(+)